MAGGIIFDPERKKVSFMTPSATRWGGRQAPSISEAKQVESILLDIKRKKKVVRGCEVISSEGNCKATLRTRQALSVTAARTKKHRGQDKALHYWEEKCKPKIGSLFQKGKSAMNANNQKKKNTGVVTSEVGCISSEKRGRNYTMLKQRPTLLKRQP